MKNCQNCKFYQEKICHLPIWVDGRKYEGQITKPENICDLFEEALMTMEMAE